MTIYETGYMKETKDWNGWPSKVRRNGTVVQVQRSHALPIEATTYKGAEFVSLIETKSVGLEDVQVALSGTGGGQGFRDDKFLVVSGWTSELTESEEREVKLVTFK